MSTPTPPSGRDEHREDDNPYATPSEPGTEADPRAQPRYGRYAPGTAGQEAGQEQSGQPPYDAPQPPYGQDQPYGPVPPYGQNQPYGPVPPYGQNQYGQNQYGQNQYGQGNQGYGPDPYGNQGYGQPPYGNQQGYPGQPYLQPWAPAPPRSGMATAAMICSLAAIATCGISGIVGLVLGIVALLRINRETRAGRVLVGRGMAITGIVVGAVFVLFILLFLGTGGPSGVVDGWNQGYQETYGDYSTL